VRVKFVTYTGTMQETCLRLMGKKMLVALMMEGNGIALVQLHGFLAPTSDHQGKGGCQIGNAQWPITVKGDRFRCHSPKADAFQFFRASKLK
jgi:hypothetical protein